MRQRNIIEVESQARQAMPCQKPESSRPKQGNRLEVGVGTHHRQSDMSPSFLPNWREKGSNKVATGKQPQNSHCGLHPTSRSPGLNSAPGKEHQSREKFRVPKPHIACTPLQCNHLPRLSVLPTKIRWITGMMGMQSSDSAGPDGL